MKPRRIPRCFTTVLLLRPSVSEKEINSLAAFSSDTVLIPLFGPGFIAENVPSPQNLLRENLLEAVSADKVLSKLSKKIYKKAAALP